MTDPDSAATRGPAAGLGWLALAGVSWGTSGTLGTLLRAASGLGFLAVAGYRIAVGGLLILGFVAVTRSARWPRTRAGWTRVGAMALTAGAFQWAFFSAISLIGVAMATLITIGSTPIMVLAVEAASGRQRLNGRLALTLAIAAAGLGLLVGTPPDGRAADALLPGVASALAAGACFAAISLLGARPEPDYHDLTGTGLAFVAGGVAVLGLAAATGPVGFEPSWASAALLLALGLVPSAVAYLAYLRGLRTQSGTTGALMSLLEPVTATILATVVLGERLTPPALAGAALLLAAVALASTAARVPESAH